MKNLFLVSCLSLTLTVSAQNSSEFYEKALASYAEQDFEATYIYLKNSLQKNEDNLPAKILMGKVLMISGYLEEAETELEEALNLGADPSLVADTLGKVWLFTNQNEKIIDTEFKNLNSQSVTDWQIIVATAHLNLRNIEGAREEYLGALKNQPTNIRALNALALLEMGQENFSIAKNYLDKSNLLEPENPHTLRLMGDLYLRQKDISQAIALYKRSYELDSDDPLIKRSLVTAYLQNQDTEAARILLDKILEQTPGDPTGMLLKAWLLAKNQMSDDAARELENLSAQLAGLTGETLSEDPTLIYVSGLSAFALQNYAQAKAFFIQYLTLVPNHIEAIALLAQTHVKLNEPKPALEAMQRHERKLMEKIENAMLLAELYLANGKAFKAVEITNKLKEQYPENPNVELLEIKTLMSRGKLELALNQLNESKSASTNVRFIIARAQIFMAMGKMDEADKIADQLLELAPENIDFLNLKAGILIRQRNLADAEGYLDRALAINPQHFSARFNKANLLSSRGEHDKAIEIVEQLNTIQPDTVDVLTLLARNQYNAGEIDSAVKNLERVLEKDIDNLTALELLATIYAQKGEPERAIRQLNIAIKTEPEQARYQMQRVELYLALKQFDRVKRELRKIQDLVKKDAVGLVELSKIQFKANDIEGAKNSIAAAYEIYPDSQFLAIEYVRTHIATNDLTKARDMLDKWLTLNPDNPQLLVLSGDIYLTGNDKNAAANAYFKALDVASNYRAALAKLYQLTLAGVGQTQFESKVTELVKNNPQDHFQRNLLADFLLNQGRYDEALPHYEQLLAVDALPNKVFILNNMANIYLDKDLNKAQSYIEQAMQEGVEIAALYDTQGWIKSLKGQHEEALTILRKAFAMDSDDPSNQYHLAYTLHKLNRDSEAKVSLQRALDSSKPFNEKQDAQALLEKL
ncbi:XrtA/PEP-CTERM system TPR-repeat protein PrsT [Aliiglaciecola litoralis]|uniref:XrtA/PEP-CTERM system TPR-repeat protein PrsT n=1 Tax=Aliiglaciecola litoralis TaxID=582857 RepID=UPI0031DAC728